MINRMLSHCGDETCTSCMFAGDYIFLAHHGGRLDQKEIKHQARASFVSVKRTLAAVDATLHGIAYKAKVEKTL